MVERGEHLQRRVEPAGRSPAAGLDDGVAPDDLAVLDAVQVQRHPVAGADPLLASGRRLWMARTRAGRAAGTHHDVVAHGERAAA